MLAFDKKDKIKEEFDLVQSKVWDYIYPTFNFDSKSYASNAAFFLAIESEIMRGQKLIEDFKFAIAKAWDFGITVNYSELFEKMNEKIEKLQSLSNGNVSLKMEPFIDERVNAAIELRRSGVFKTVESSAFFWHVTHVKNLKSIINNGLIPREMIFKNNLSSFLPDEWSKETKFFKENPKNMDWNQSYVEYSKNSVRFASLGEKTYKKWFLNSINESNLDSFIAFRLKSKVVNGKRLNIKKFRNEWFWKGSINIMSDAIDVCLLREDISLLDETSKSSIKSMVQQLGKRVVVLEYKDIKRCIFDDESIKEISCLIFEV